VVSRNRRGDKVKHLKQPTNKKKMKKLARYWKENHQVACTLCPHGCKLKKNQRGLCGVRENQNGKLYSLIYGACSSTTPDPIEKKPLYHFYPGTRAFSLGTVGCNLSCKHCQNYTITQQAPESAQLYDLLPEEAVRQAQETRCRGIAWTYNEPTIWWEYTYDSAKLAKKKGLYTVYVTNGYISEDPLKEVSRYLDAANVDVKSMDNEFYKRICGGTVEPVLETCIRMRELGIHLELTYLVIPTKNDSKESLQMFCRWVLDNLGADIAVHFSAFFPHYKMADLPSTSMKKMLEGYEVAKEMGINYPYLGNVPHGRYENTYCPRCGETLVERHGFSATITGITKGVCKGCGKSIPIVI
jgi:pyruvate formate lyase activating enzyme